MGSNTGGKNKPRGPLQMSELLQLFNEALSLCASGNPERSANRKVSVSSTSSLYRTLHSTVRGRSLAARSKAKAGLSGIRRIRPVKLDIRDSQRSLPRSHGVERCITRRKKKLSRLKRLIVREKVEKALKTAEARVHNTAASLTGLRNKFAEVQTLLLSKEGTLPEGLGLQIGTGSGRLDKDSATCSGTSAGSEPPISVLALPPGPLSSSSKKLLTSTLHILWGGISTLEEELANSNEELERARKEHKAVHTVSKRTSEARKVTANDAETEAEEQTSAITGLIVGNLKNVVDSSLTDQSADGAVEAQRPAGLQLQLPQEYSGGSVAKQADAIAAAIKASITGKNDAAASVLPDAGIPAETLKNEKLHIPTGIAGQSESKEWEADNKTLKVDEETIDNVPGLQDFEDTLAKWDMAAQSSPSRVIDPAVTLPSSIGDYMGLRSRSQVEDTTTAVRQLPIATESEVEASALYYRKPQMRSASSLSSSWKAADGAEVSGTCTNRAAGVHQHQQAPRPSQGPGQRARDQLVQAQVEVQRHPERGESSGSAPYGSVVAWTSSSANGIQKEHPLLSGSCSIGGQPLQVSGNECRPLNAASEQWQGSIEQGVHSILNLDSWDQNALPVEHEADNRFECNKRATGSVVDSALFDRSYVSQHGDPFLSSPEQWSLHFGAPDRWQAPGKAAMSTENVQGSQYPASICGMHTSSATHVLKESVNTSSMATPTELHENARIQNYLSQLQGVSVLKPIEPSSKGAPVLGAAACNGGMVHVGAMAGAGFGAEQCSMGVDGMSRHDSMGASTSSFQGPYTAHELMGYPHAAAHLGLLNGVAAYQPYAEAGPSNSFRLAQPAAPGFQLQDLQQQQYQAVPACYTVNGLHTLPQDCLRYGEQIPVYNNQAPCAPDNNGMWGPYKRLSAKKKKSLRELSAEAKQDSNFTCEICHKSCNSMLTLQQHFNSNKHLHKAALVGLGPVQAIAAKIGMQALAGDFNRMGQCYKICIHPCCEQELTTDLDDAVKRLLTQIKGFQDTAMQINAVKAKARRWYVCGLREVQKAVEDNHAVCVVLAPNIEQIQVQGGLDEHMKAIISHCNATRVPVVFALNRKLLGDIYGSRKKMSAIALLCWNGCNEIFDETLKLAKELQALVSFGVYVENVNDDLIEEDMVQIVFEICAG